MPPTGPGRTASPGLTEQRQPRRRPRPAPLALAASVTTIWAALVSFVPAMVVVGFLYAVDSSGDPLTSVLRLGIAGWLLAHGVPVQTGHGAVQLAPLAVTALVAWRVARAGVHTARAIGARRRRAAWRTLAAGTAVGVVYAGIGALAAAAASLPQMSVGAPRAALTLGVFGLVAGLLGASAEAGILARWTALVPRVVRDGVRTGAVAALLVLGAGAATAGMAVALAGGEATWVLSGYGTGVVGQAGLILVCLLYGPNIAVWTASYLIGPGFTLGADSTISAAKVTLGTLPKVPVLAGLEATPDSGSFLLALPLAAGMAAGWLLIRRMHQVPTRRRRRRPHRRRVPERVGDPAPQHPSWMSIVLTSVIAAGVTGGVLALASIAASGSLGAGRLASVGPRTVPVALAGAGVVGLGVIVAAAGSQLLIRPGGTEK